MVDAWHEQPHRRIHPPSFGSRLTSNENSEDEAVAPPPPVRPPPPFAVVDDPDVDVVPDVVGPEVVDPDVVDVDVVVAVVEPEALVDLDSLEEDSSGVGSSASCTVSGTV